MSQLSGFLLTYFQAVYIVGWVGALLFPLMLALTMRFWESEMGMHFFAYGLAVWLSLTPGTAFIIFGDFPGRGILGLVFFHAVVIVIWWRAILFIKIYRINKKGGDLDHLP